MSAPVVARDARYEPIRHYGAGVRPTRTGWLVSFEVLADGSRRNCCASTHGHRTRANAKKCLTATLARMIRNQQVGGER